MLSFQFSDYFLTAWEMVWKSVERSNEKVIVSLHCIKFQKLKFKWWNKTNHIIFILKLSVLAWNVDISFLKIYQ